MTNTEAVKQAIVQAVVQAAKATLLAIHEEGIKQHMNNRTK